jgi:hypothetical protein
VTRVEWRKFRGKYERYDTEFDRVCQRITGGIGWSGEKPGAIVALAEEMVHRPPAPVYVLGVFESYDLEQLCKQMVIFRHEFKIEEFFGNDTNLACVNYISQRNHDAKYERWKTINVLGAPYVDQLGNISYHVQELKKALDPGKKLLVLNSKRLAAALSEIAIENISSLKDSDVPLISALAYGYTQLHVNQYLYGEDHYPKANMDYDIFAHNLESERR